MLDFIWKKIFIKIQTIRNSFKSNSNAFYHAIDVSLGGQLTLLETNMKKAFQGYLRNKFDDLIFDLNNNGISIEEFISFIQDLQDEERDFLYLSIQKTFNAKDPIKIYFIGLLLSKKIRKLELNYFEECLFSNMDMFTINDFNIIYDVLTSYNQKQDLEGIYTYSSHGEHYRLITIKKFISYGLLYEREVSYISGDGGILRDDILFESNQFTKEFFINLKSFND